MKNLKKFFNLALSFFSFLIVKEVSAVEGTKSSSANIDKISEIDKRVNDVRNKLKEHMKNNDAQRTFLEFKKYSAGNEWVNWGNWGNWNNWNDWNNWRKWNDFSNWQKFPNW